MLTRIRRLCGGLSRTCRESVPSDRTAPYLPSPTTVASSIMTVSAGTSR